MKRLYFTGLFVCLSCSFCQAQWTRQDSIRLKQILSEDKEIKLNTEAVKSIRLNVPSLSDSPHQALLPDNRKNILDFDLSLPRFYTMADSLSFRSKRIYLSLRPYGIQGFARPTSAPLPFVVRREVRKRSLRPPIHNEAILSQPGVAGRVNGPIGCGISVSFSAEDVLQFLFSKKGRARMHNAEHAKAWKTY